MVKKTIKAGKTCQNSQSQRKTGCCENYYNDYCEARIADKFEYEAYVAEEEEALAAEEEAYEALLSEVLEEEEIRAQNTHAPLADEEYEYYVALYVNREDDNLYGLEAA